jgi:hypothetical protein
MLHSPAKVATHPRGVAAKRERVIAWESRRINKVILQGIQVEPGVSEEVIVRSLQVGNASGRKLHHSIEKSTDLGHRKVSSRRLLISSFGRSP